MNTNEVVESDATNIFYTRDDKSTRHYCLNGRETLCGKIPFAVELLALPVNCDECRTQAGKRGK